MIEPSVRLPVTLFLFVNQILLILNRFYKTSFLKKCIYSYKPLLLVFL